MTTPPASGELGAGYSVGGADGMLPSLARKSGSGASSFDSPSAPVVSASMMALAGTGDSDEEGFVGWAASERGGLALFIY